ncbi:MAG TPA: metallophosphoesterase [Planctomycetota bacterium]|nr:metallophosphoesterase [Planctomycetota bacterium]
MAENEKYCGLLFIGDPHLEGRQPGFRKDDYAQVVLEKVAWCLSHARENRLLPVMLGDLFDKPRDNPTWMLGRLIELLGSGECIGVYGNHDCAEPALNDHDSLSLLIKAGCLRMVSEEQPWRGRMNGRTVIVGGSSYRRPIPHTFEPGCGREENPLVIWLAHHDLIVSGYDAGRIKPCEIERVDLVINGHIHRHLEDVRTGRTLWLTPGNISRRSRNDAVREHKPSALRIDVSATGETLGFVEIPHRPFEEVFHEAVVDGAAVRDASAFVAGLAELQARRTDSGAGLKTFLANNLGQFDKAVADEIMVLATEVTEHGESESREIEQRREAAD